MMRYGVRLRGEETLLRMGIGGSTQDEEQQLHVAAPTHVHARLPQTFFLQVGHTWHTR